MAVLHVGIDYSMSCPAICIYDDAGPKFCFPNCSIYFLTPKKAFQGRFKNVIGHEHLEWADDQQRFHQISEWALKVILGNYGDYHTKINLWMEAYSYGSKGSVFNIAENTGLLKHKLWLEKIPIQTVPPTTIKKFATGSGKGNKDPMYAAFKDKTGKSLYELFNKDEKTVKIDSPIGDIVDSYFICEYGFSHFLKTL